MSDDPPERPRTRLTILPLDSMGIAELEAYIVELRGEIDRAEAMIVRKQQHRSAMQAVFGKPRQTD